MDEESGERVAARGRRDQGAGGAGPLREPRRDARDGRPAGARSSPAPTRPSSGLRTRSSRRSSASPRSAPGPAKRLRRTVSRETGLVARSRARPRSAAHSRGRDRLPRRTTPFSRRCPAGTMACLLVPLLLERGSSGLVALVFHETPATARAREPRGASSGTRRRPSRGRGRAERKTTGLLSAIERLTNLYDVTKTFGSTIDLGELSTLIARKSAELAGGEVASLWMLDGRTARWRSRPRRSTRRTTCRPRTAASAAPSWATSSPAGRSSARNGLDADDPLGGGDSGFPVRSILAVPLVEDGTPLGAIVVVNKRGRHPEFTAADEELLVDIAHGRPSGRCTTRGSTRPRRRSSELDALLAVSREITSTLDLDKVMRTIVNATSALIRYDRCAIAILQRGALRIGAVSGAGGGGPERPVRPADGGAPRVGLLRRQRRGRDAPGGRHDRDRPPRDRGEVPRLLRRERPQRLLRRPSRGRRRESSASSASSATSRIEFDAETRDLLQILVNQATVAVRNAQLYQQVPLAGFLWQPSSERTRKLRRPARRAAGGAGPSARAAALVLLALVPWNVRVAGAGARRSRPADPGDGVRGRRRRERSSTARETPWPRATSSRRSATTPTEPPSPRRAPPSRSPRPTSRRYRAEGNAAGHVPGDLPPRRDARARSGPCGGDASRGRDSARPRPASSSRPGSTSASASSSRPAPSSPSSPRRRPFSSRWPSPSATRRFSPSGRRSTSKMNSYPDRTFHGTRRRTSAPPSARRARSASSSPRRRVENPGRSAQAGNAREGQGLDRTPRLLRGAPPEARALDLGAALAPPAVSAAAAPAASRTSRPRAADARRGARRPPRRRGSSGPALRKDLVIRRQVQIGEVT